MDTPNSPVPEIDSEGSETCTLCGRRYPLDDIIHAENLRPELFDYIEAQHPAGWGPRAHICQPCLNEQRIAFVLDRLEQERGELTAVEADVAAKAALHESVVEQLDEQFARKETFGQRTATLVAEKGGSWGFVIAFLTFLVVWMAANILLLRSNAFDPYPFILLNLVLSCLAAIQAPIIMMSQNRLAARDRLQADQDFRVNLKAEIEIATLHEKMDHLLNAQWQRMVELQEVQLDLLNELAGRTPSTRPRT